LQKRWLNNADHSLAAISVIQRVVYSENGKPLMQRRKLEAILLQTSKAVLA
jgi:hypothetical protein